MAWTEQMVEDLKRMWAEGLTTGEIGKRLGVSKNSVVGKVHRLQLPARPSPIKKKEDSAEKNKINHTETIKKEKPVEKQTPEKKPNKDKENEKTTTNQEEIISVSLPLTDKTSSKHSGKTMLTDLDNHTCRWPIGDPKDENFHFCGKKVKIGQTYCEEHANIAYVKPGKK